MELSQKEQKEIERLNKLALGDDIALVKELEQIDEQIEEIGERVTTLENIEPIVLPTKEELKGDKGEKGERGEKGDKGADGKDGKDGKDGRDGIDGKEGPAGRDGKDGAPGKAGWGAHPLVVKGAGTSVDKNTRILNFVDSTVTRNSDGTVNVESNGGVSSVSNSDGTLTISPTTGAVVASRAAITGDVSIPVGSNTATINASAVDHNSLANLTVGDVHTQYAFLAGRSGGQSLTGGTASGNDLTLISTSNATKGSILVPENSFEMTSNRSRHDAEDSGFIVDAGGNARLGLMKFSGYFPAFTRGLGAGLSMGEYSNASLAVNGGTYTEEVNLSDSGFRFDIDAWGNGEDKGLFWDSGGNTRLGFVKKSGAVPCLAFGNLVDFEIKEWSTTSMLTNIASGSGTSRFKIASGGLTSIYNSLTIGSGAAGTDYTLTFDGETNNGIVTWMEDEDYFQFSDDIFMESAERLYFRANNVYIHSPSSAVVEFFVGSTPKFSLNATTEVFQFADITQGDGIGFWTNTLQFGGASLFIGANTWAATYRTNVTIANITSSTANLLELKTGASSTSSTGTTQSVVDYRGYIGAKQTSPTAYLHLGAGTTSASTAPLKFTSGTSMTSAEAGAVEYTTDDLFFTISTGTARKRILFADPSGGLTSGRVPFATTNGRLTDDSDLTFATDTLTATHYRANATITFDEEVDNGNSSTADTIDWTAGNVQKSTLTGNVTYTFTAPSAPGLFSLKMTQDATGGRTATWPATVKWQRGINPFNGTQAASEIDIAYFRFDGTNYQAWATFDHK